MDIVRVASKTSSALTTVAEVIEMATEENPKAADTLRSCSTESNRTKRVVDLVRKQKGLQTAGGLAILHRIQKLAEEIDEYVGSLGPGRDSEPLSDLKERLQGTRRDLCKEVRAAWAGLTKTSEGKLLVSAQILQSTDEAVKAVLGKENGLHIAAFLNSRNRKADSKGNIHLGQSEYEELIRAQSKIAHPEMRTINAGEKTRIICNCLARDQSLQILGPISVDLWKDIAFIKIEGLVATDKATQFGYPITMDVFQKVLDSRRV